MINMAPWYYRHLLENNSVIDPPDFYQIKLLSDQNVFESNVRLKNYLRPSWLSTSSLYKDCDGTGTSQFKNVAVYKAISEALERYAFYVTIDNNEAEYAFDKNPTTTGLAAYPSLGSKMARRNAHFEAAERWAIFQFNNKNIPVIYHPEANSRINFFELIVPFEGCKVVIIHHEAAFGNV